MNEEKIVVLGHLVCGRGYQRGEAVGAEKAEGEGEDEMANGKFANSK